MQWDRDGDDHRRATRPYCVHAGQLVWLEGSSANNHSKQLRGFERIVLSSMRAAGKNLLLHLACRNVAGTYFFVINPEQCRGSHAHRSDSPPDPAGLVLDLSEMMNQQSTEPAPDKRSDSNG